MKRRVYKNPKLIIDRFTQDVKDDLGVADGQAWTLRDWAKRIPWNNLKTYMKFMEMLIAVDELLGKGEVLSARAQLVQNMKGVHQAVLDGTSWKNAWLLTGLNDPGQRRRFGGGEDELEICNNMLKVVEDLDRRVSQTRHTTDAKGSGAAEAGEEDAPKGKGKGK